MNDELKELGISSVKSLFAAVPFASGVLNEAFFDYRSRVKQNRINKFSEELSDYLKSFEPNSINTEYIKSDEFGDIFESIVRRVISTGSDEKIQRFKEVLANQIRQPYISDFTETFLDIISRINEKQIEILLFYKELQLKRGENVLIKKEGLPIHFNITLEEYDFYTQDLISKSLLNYRGITMYDASPQDFINITGFGMKFLSFIENK